MKKIKITCKGSRSVPIGELQDFQGDLKTLSTDNFQKLKRLLIKRGFSFPVFVWGDNKILDGHQRLSVLTSMIDSGEYDIDGDIPVCDIEAKTEKEAAEKLLELQGQYGNMSFKSIDVFINDFDVDIKAIANDLKIPELGDFIKCVTGESGKLYSGFNDIDDTPDTSKSEKELYKDNIPITIILSKRDYDLWEDFKQNKAKSKTDKTALLKAIKNWR